MREAKKDPKSPEKFKIKTAVADGQTVSFEVAKTLPTRLEAIGDVLSALLGAGGSIAGCLSGPAAQLVGCIAAVEEKNKGKEPQGAGATT